MKLELQNITLITQTFDLFNSNMLYWTINRVFILQLKNIKSIVQFYIPKICNPLNRDPYTVVCNPQYKYNGYVFMSTLRKNFLELFVQFVLNLISWLLKRRY